MLLACRAVGGDISLAWNAAVAIELLHNFTLVHDDIMDQDDIRRGRATVHKRWNLATAILAGDGLFALSYKALLKTRAVNLRGICNVFTEGVLTICEGQALDLDFETRPSVTLSAYVDMIGRKTAALLSTAAQIGAMIGQGSEAEVSALGKFAHNLGLAFQIQDDLLDIIADETTLGKTHGSDIRQKKQTYLLIHAYENGNIDQRRELAKQMDASNGIGRIKDLFEQIGSVQAARQAISQFISAAKDCLAPLPISRDKDNLLRLLGYISNREA